MPIQTRPQYMPQTEVDAVAWLMQRAAEVNRVGAICIRFGPGSVNSEEAEKRLAEGREVPSTNIQAFADATVKLERALYTYYSHMTGRSPQVAAPGLVERLTRAEEALQGMVDGSQDETQMARDYFKWLREQRHAPTSPED